MTFEVEYVQKNVFTYFVGDPDGAPILNVILHGFPGEKGNRNHDLAEVFHNKLGSPSFILHYEGLGQSLGYFSFYNSIHDSVKIIKAKINQNKVTKVNIIGHSWGGLIGLFLACELKSAVNKIVLLSPYFDIPSQEVLQETIRQLKVELPHVLRRDDAVYFAELSKIRTEIRNLDIANLSFLEILYAKNDETVIFENLKNFLTEAGIRHNIKIVEQDHSFLIHRDLTLQQVATMLGE